MNTRSILPAFFALIAAGFGIREGLTQDAPAVAPPGADARRLNRLYAEFKCKCPKENWTRTLAGCFEPCVDPQKGLVRRLVAEGLSDEKIRLRMILDAGTEQVLARPSSLPNYIPYAIFATLGLCVLFVLRHMLRQGRIEGGLDDDSELERRPTDELMDARIEAELDRLKD
jgi:hypothetical protein